MKKLLIALAVVFSVATSLEAIEAEFSYQGVLKDKNNVAIQGLKEVELRLYATTNNNALVLWGRRYSVLLDANGLFNAEVSDRTGSSISGVTGTGLSNVLANNETIYIGLTMGGTSGEIKPRQKLLAVPFAAVAGNVATANGNFTVSGQLSAKSATISNALTANNLSVADTVSVASLSTRGSVQIGGNLTVTGEISGFGTIPLGSIIMWSGETNNIPNGWALCDGQKYGNWQTPDLRDRFIVGAGNSYTNNATGGAAKVTLTLSQIPSHSHEFQFTGADVDGKWKESNFFYNLNKKYPNFVNTNHTETAGGNASGLTEPHENLPPFHALYFIMRVL